MITEAVPMGENDHITAILNVSELPAQPDDSSLDCQAQGSDDGKCFTDIPSLRVSGIRCPGVYSLKGRVDFAQVRFRLDLCAEGDRVPEPARFGFKICATPGRAGEQ